MKLVLASKSPRRKRVLSEMGYEFDVIPSNADESGVKVDGVRELVERLATLKAETVANSLKDAVVIGVDTVVYCDGVVLGKPKDLGDARRMLLSFSNKAQQIVHGYCVMNTSTGTRAAGTSVVNVEFNELTPAMVEEYIEYDSPLDKSGSYYMPDIYARGFIKRIDTAVDDACAFSRDDIESALRRVGYNK
jgi:septum formation protein